MTKRRPVATLDRRHRNIQFWPLACLVSGQFETVTTETEDLVTVGLIHLVMAFYSLVRILGECLTIQFPPALFFFF